MNFPSGPFLVFSLLLFGATGCGERSRRAPIRVVAPRLAVPCAGLPGPVVLAPRHRILSPAPTLQIVTPGFAGQIEVTLATGGGVRHRLRTTRRAIPWPDGVDLIAIGDWGWVRVAAPSGVAYAGFERAPPPDPRSLWLEGPRADARWLLDHDLPMEAFLLLAAEGLADGEEAQCARRRASFPEPGVWRPLKVSDSIRRSRQGVGNGDPDRRHR